jgi:hypothetical protein
VADKPKGPGAWMKSVDLVHDGDRLAVVQMPVRARSLLVVLNVESWSILRFEC